MSAFRKFDLKQEPIALEYIPTGIRGLDQLFGGGLPYNHLILIEEDEFNVYSNLLLRAVSSNVIHDKVNLTYFSDKISSDPSAFVKKLPSKTKVDSKTIDSPRDMQIAFRYNYMPSLDNETGFIMDFGRLLEERNFKSQVNIDSIAIYPIKDVLDVMEKYTKNQVSSHSFNNGSTSKSRHLIILDHLSCCTSSLSSDSICAFIYQLKSFARQLSSYTILVTIQSGWLSNVTTKRLRNISDTSIQLESFDPLQPSAYSDDYKGALHVHKVTRASSSKDSLVADLGFQLKKNNRYFIVEKLFLPPDIGDTPSRVPTKSNTADDIF